jgi:hypothetical protein
VGGEGGELKFGELSHGRTFTLSNLRGGDGIHWVVSVGQ